jgi:PleD family two-component response regulator
VDQKRFRISGVRGPIHQTVSVGAATLGADDRSGLSQVQFINRSDKALYQAKRLGKNRMAEYED